MKLRLLALLCFAALFFSACAPEMPKQEEELQIYASFYPIYALSSLVLDNIPGAGLKCLVQPQDDCLRLYDLSDWDASVLAYDADAIIIGGRGLESFENALYTFGDSGPAIITALYSLELYNDDGLKSIDGSTGHLADANPHLYMSVDGAREMLQVITNALKQFIPDQAEALENNYAAADKRLTSLKNEICGLLSGVNGKKVILLNEALIYTAQDAGLDVVYHYDRESGTSLYGSSLDDALDAFAGLDAEVILIEKQAPQELTNALENAGYTVCLIDIMSSFSSDDNGDGYFDKQLANASAIAAAFNKN